MPVDPVSKPAVGSLSLPSYNATTSFLSNISTPASLRFIPGVNRALPFGYNPMFNPMFALAQTLGPSLAQFLASLSSLFGNKNGSASSAAASRGSSGSQSTPPTRSWPGAEKAQDCGGACGEKSKGDPTPQDSAGPSRDRSESPETRRESPGPTRAPEETHGADDGHGH